MLTHSFSARVLRYLLPALGVALTAAPDAHAQRGGRGRSGSVTVTSSALQRTPMQRAKDSLKDTDPIEFINDHGKQLQLEKEQKESLKKLQKEMQEEQKPVFKELEKLYGEMERNGGGGSRGGFTVGAVPADPPIGESAGGGAGASSPVRLLTARLMEMQTGYGEKASALLTESQRQVNDSLSTIFKAELREKQAKARGRGRG